MCDVMKELMREDREQYKEKIGKTKKQSNLNFDIAVKMAYDSFCDGRYTLNEAADKLHIKPELLRKRFDRLSAI